ncbi:MAG: hypothetical protein ABSB28_04105 [Candidatus Bathyarchaeia archaeon]
MAEEQMSSTSHFPKEFRNTLARYIDGIVNEADPRLAYFVSLFASASFALRNNTTDLDLVFEGSISHAQDIENDLKRKVFSIFHLP